MSEIRIIEHIPLDGVIQAPGGRTKTHLIPMADGRGLCGRVRMAMRGNESSGTALAFCMHYHEKAAQPLGSRSRNPERS